MLVPLFLKFSGLFLGDYHTLVQDFRRLRQSHFFAAFRMTPEIFDLLLEKVQSNIEKKVTKFRLPISACERLLVTLK